MWCFMSGMRGESMKKIIVALASLLWLASALLIAVPASAQMTPPPRWGDYNDAHQWREASWWWQNNPNWVRHHHPEWWGDWDQNHIWRPAGWWYQHDPSWIYAHHPEWWG